MLSRYFSLVLEDRNCLVVSRNFSGGSWHLSALSVVLVPPESHRDFRIAGGLRSLSIYTEGLESLGSLLIYAGSPQLSTVATPQALHRRRCSCCHSSSAACVVAQTLHHRRCLCRHSSSAAACVATRALHLRRRLRSSQIDQALSNEFPENEVTTPWAFRAAVMIRKRIRSERRRG